jgi:eukaryotic-like serine/threonine-protein kinase
MSGHTPPLCAATRNLKSMPPSIRDDRIAGPVVDDRYLLLGRLGIGGTAIVYRAEDVVLRRRVVIKVLHEWFTDDDEAVRRFRREAATASGLRHPNIVSVYGSGEWNGRHFIVLEHVHGRSLKTLIRERAPLAPGCAIELTAQLLRAVGYIHRLGIVHRDLKPDNVMINSDGQLKLTDFGVARPPESEITQTGNILGTAQYMSPEQAHGEQVGTASDLYSLAVMLYELLTGRAPFDAATAMGVLFKHVHGQAIPPSGLNPRVTPSLDAIVVRALDKDPTARFADAAAFMTALEHARGSVDPAVSAAWAWAA